MSVVGLKVIDENNNLDKTTFKNDLKVFTIDDFTEMVVDSKEFETEITFNKEHTISSGIGHDSTYVQDIRHDANGDFRN